MAILWRIEFFGGLRARRDNEVVTRFRTQKTAALLAYLALRPGPQPREVLVGLLWPDAEPDAARNSLSAALSSLRRQLEKNLLDGSILLADRASIGLNPTSFTTDISEFEHALKAAANSREDAERIRLLSQAVELYQGPALPGFYDEWAMAQARCREEEFFEASSDLIDLLDSEGQPERALHYARRGVSLYPGHEAWNLSLMRLLRGMGHHESVLRHYREFESILQRDGLTPSEAARRIAQDAERNVKTARNTAEPSVVEVAERPNQPVADQVQADQTQQEFAAPTPVASTQNVAMPLSTAALPASTVATPIVAAPTVAAPPPASALPVGTVALLMTDRPHEDKEAQYLAQELERHEGHILREAPDAALWVFSRASDAVTAVSKVQSSLLRLSPEDRPRMALCSGEVELVRGDYRGEALERVRRLHAAANRGQIVCCEATANLGRQADIHLQRSGTLLNDSQSSFRELGIYRLLDSGTECLFQVEYPAAPQFAPIRLAASISHRLPAQFTRFFGRNSEIEQLRRLLTRDNVRLLTLTGPGGSGKTRLAVETTRSLLSHWREAVWFVPLADITDTSFIFTAIRDTLKLPVAPNVSPQEQIVEALSNQPALLLLDNFEQLVEEGAAQVQELLERLPSLTILITSRQVLCLPGEREFPVLPLPVPHEELPPEKIKEYSSTALFIDRAQAARVDFRVDERNAAAVAAVCRRLDGIPLAIELAAARSLVLSPAQMLEKLKDRLDLLSTRQRGIPERHRTLRAAIEWSYGLLSPELQRFFTSLSVFRGGWTIEAAEAVCREPEALDFLTRLRECSLVVTEERPSEIRFRMLETLREYALSQLQDGERAEMERRYATHFMTMAEDSEPHLRGPEQAMWLERLDGEQDNFRAVLAWAVEHDATGALRLAAALAPFWETRGYYAEGRNWLERALARSTVPDDDPRAETPSTDDTRTRPLTGSGWLAYSSDLAPATVHQGRQGEVSVAAPLSDGPLCDMTAPGLVDGADETSRIEEVLGAGAGSEPEVLRARALCSAGRMAWYEMELVTARTLLEESLTTFRKCSDGIGTVSAINSLILVLSWQGECSVALSLLHEGKTILQQMPDRQRILPLLAGFGWAISWLSMAESLDDSWVINSEVERLARAANDKRSLAWALNGLGMCSYWRGDCAEARTFLQESEAYFRHLGEPNGVGHSVWAVSNVARLEGDYKEAYALNADSMTMGIGVKNYMGLPYHLESFAYLAIAVQKPQRAVQLLAAAEKTRELYRSRKQPLVVQEYENYLAVLRPMLSESEFQTAWAQGYARPTGAAIEYSLQDDYSPT
ncbi:MAG TPA: BTAD domain-containing putative transcriptional regulator [Abditibacteriaceae bacterium]